MLRIRKQNPPEKNSQDAQTAIEYLLLLSVVTAIVLIAFNGNYLGRVFNAANLYFDRAAVGIYGDGSKCGDGNCQGHEDFEICPLDCGPDPEPPDPMHCETQRIISGDCPMELSLPQINNGATYSRNCPVNPFGCSGIVTLKCTDAVLAELSSCDGPGVDPGGELPGPDEGPGFVGCPDPPPVMIGNCQTPVDVGDMHHNERRLIICGGGPFGLGCENSNPDHSVEAHCFDGFFSVLGACNSINNPPESTPCADSTIGYPDDGAGCEGAVHIPFTEDGGTFQAACPDRCTPGTVTGRCDRGFFIVDSGNFCNPIVEEEEGGEEGG